jgi:hypothetical protein
MVFCYHEAPCHLNGGDIKIFFFKYFSHFPLHSNLAIKVTMSDNLLDNIDIKMTKITQSCQIFTESIQSENVKFLGYIFKCFIQHNYAFLLFHTLYPFHYILLFVYIFTSEFHSIIFILCIIWITFNADEGQTVQFIALYVICHLSADIQTQTHFHMILDILLIIYFFNKESLLNKIVSFYYKPSISYIFKMDIDIQIRMLLPPALICWQTDRESYPAKRTETQLLCI